MRKFWGLIQILIFFLNPYKVIAAQEFNPFKIDFRYEKGQASSKKEFSGGLTFLQWNICFLPDGFPLLYGGVKKAMQRVEGVAQFIVDVDADLVVLQEAHDHEAVKELVKRMRIHYPHIYYDIGSPVIFGDSDFEQPFLNSGLLVMSKFPLSKLSFKNYDYSGRQWQINKGYFDFTIEYEGKELMHVVATHLQPYDEAKDRAIRELELKEIIQVIEARREASPASLPHVLLGDLNIPWGSPEYAASSLGLSFKENYTNNLQFVTSEMSTATDFLTDYRNSAPNKEYLRCLNEGISCGEYNPYAVILDYFLVYRTPQENLFSTKALETFPTNFEECGAAALKALSDHKAMVTTIMLEGVDKAS